MPTTVDWGSKIIQVYQADMAFISGLIYELDVDVLRLELKNLEDSEEGMVHLNTHQHNTEVTLAGVTYARTFEIINGYRVDFIPIGGDNYVIRAVGANHNLSDVIYDSPIHRHFILIVGNAAGLITVNIAGPSLVDANILSIDGSTQSAALMRIAAETMITGVIATVASTTEFTVTFSNFASEETTSLQGRRIIIVSGTKAKEAARITSYAGNGMGNPATIEVTELSSLPIVGTTVVVV